MYNPQDHYFKKAKKEWYKARSIFKLEEIDQKFKLIDKKTSTVLDIGCAPGSWLQYTATKIKNPHAKILGFDIKAMEIAIPWVDTYQQDITDQDAIKKIFEEHKIKKFDFIQSDMAPNTIGVQDVDAIRSIALLEETLRIYKEFLAPEGKFAIKIFMGPGFEEFLRDLKKHFWWKKIKVYKPKACRDQSKETYIVKL